MKCREAADALAVATSALAAVSAEVSVHCGTKDVICLRHCFVAGVVDLGAWEVPVIQVEADSAYLRQGKEYAVSEVAQ